MSRPRKGAVEWVPPAPGEQRGHYKIQITLNDGSRPQFHLDPGPRSKEAEQSARNKAESWTEKARIGNLDAAYFGIRRKKKPATEPAAEVEAPKPSMQRWIDAWVAQRKARGLASAKEPTAVYEHHIVPVLGDKHVRDWTRDDLRALCRSLDEKVQRAGSEDEAVRKRAITWKTASNVWSIVTKLCKESCQSKDHELCVRDDNPARDVVGPDRGGDKAKQYLFPSEVLAVLNFADAPVAWRRLLAISVYTFARPEEIEALEWADVDVEHATIKIRRSVDRFRERGKIRTTKSKDVRTIPIEPALLPLLAAMRKEADGKGRVVPKMPPPGMLPKKIREYLRLAGVEREALFNRDPTTLQINWYHATRATGVTWAAVRGDDPLRIMSRAGHADFQTTQIYVREAENFTRNFGSPFPNLPASLLEKPPAEDWEIKRTRPSFRTEFRTGNVAYLKTPSNWVGAAGIEPATSSV